MTSFSERHGYQPPDAEITIRHDAPPWLRSLVIDLAYECGFKPSELRTWLCKTLLESPDTNNWSERPNIDHEARGLLEGAPWYYTYDLIEWICSQRMPRGYAIIDPGSGAAAKQFAESINRAFRQKGVGWQLAEGRIQVRGPEVFEQFVSQAATLAQESGRETTRQELKEALRDLSRRPDPEVTGAIQHAMAALECLAKDVTGDTKVTLGDWIKKNASLLPKPIEAAVEKLWGYSSQFGRHVQEGKPANFDEAEMVVGLVAVLSVYLLRKAGVSGPL